MGRCLKRRQLSRDNDCLVDFVLHFRIEVAAFVVRATLRCIIHSRKHCVLHCCVAVKHQEFSHQSEVCIIRCVKNKGTVWLKPVFFVVYFSLLHSMLCFCFSCWLNNFSSFVRSLKDKGRIPVGRTVLEHTSHRLALWHERRARTTTRAGA